MSLRDLNYNFIGRDISKISQKHLKSDQFFCEIFKAFQIHLKKDIHDVSEKSPKYILQVFASYQKYLTKIVSSDFRRAIEISDKIDAGA